MLDLNLINGRYFEVKVGESVLEIEPCKLKTMRKFQKLSKNEEGEDMIDIASVILNKNRKKIKISDEVIGEINIDQLKTLLYEYFNWIANEKTANPN